MPFDGKRMIYGGFTPIIDEGAGGGGYVDGFVTPLDPAKRDEYWNSVVEAWFDGGKDDPKLTMLQMKLVDGKIWASTDSKIKFGWEIAKANLTDDMPHVGVTKDVRF